MQQQIDTDETNEAYAPSDTEAEVIDVISREGITTPQVIRESVDIRRQNLNEILSDLVSAGWIEHPARGLYKIKYNGDRYANVEVTFGTPDPKTEGEA